MELISQNQLAKRWQISPRTLEQWRWLGKGPKFIKLGARVLYRETDVMEFESSQVCQNTSGPLPREAT